MTVPLKTVGVLVLNFVVSVAIVWVNKIAYNMGFTYVIMQTVLHSVCTFVGLEGCVAAGMFQRKRLRIMDLAPITAAFCGFICFNNLSLKYNTVGIYQLMKVMTTPVVVSLEYTLYGKTLPLTQIASLGLVCIGVIMATVTTIELNGLGVVFGTLGIFSTSLYQIWVKTTQDKLQCNAQQLLHWQSPLAAAMLSAVVPVGDDLWSPSGLANMSWTATLLFVVLFSGVLAFLVNLSIFLVIGRTSPVSYNVLGHTKLCVILLSGYTVFGDPYTIQQLMGVFLAVAGIVWYTQLRLKPQTQQPQTPSSVPLASK